LNHRFAGQWDGNPGNISKIQISNPTAAFVGNTILLASQTFMPPILPQARRVSVWLNEKSPESLRDFLKRDFVRFDLTLGELPQEEASGLGLGIALLIILSACSPLFFRNGRRNSETLFRNSGRAILAATWIAFLFYMIKMGSESTGRLLVPYYPLLLATMLILPANNFLVRRRWWKACAIFCAISPLAGLILTPTRPLVPVERIIAAMENRGRNLPVLTRAKEVYAVYRKRNDVLAPLRNHIPPEAKVVGLIAGPDDSEVALWRPFGQRRVVHLSEENFFKARESRPKWIVVDTSSLKEHNVASLKEQMKEVGGRITAEMEIISRWSSGPNTWLLVNFPM
jgi:hypothetical protein